jgi:hypothetical protein
MHVGEVATLIIPASSTTPQLATIGGSSLGPRKKPETDDDPSASNTAALQTLPLPNSVHARRRPSQAGPSRARRQWRRTRLNHSCCRHRMAQHGTLLGQPREPPFVQVVLRTHATGQMPVPHLHRLQQQASASRFQDTRAVYRVRLDLFQTLPAFPVPEQAITVGENCSAPRSAAPVFLSSWLASAASRRLRRPGLSHPLSVAALDRG